MAIRDWVYAYHVIERDPAGFRAIQVFMHVAGEHATAWVLHFTERADPRRLVLQLVADTLGLEAAGGLGQVFNDLSTWAPKSLDSLERFLAHVGIPEAEGLMSLYIDPYETPQRAAAHQEQES
jgi:hypothetical protein